MILDDGLTTAHRHRLRAWEIARSWSKQELAGMLLRNVYRLTARRLRPAEVHRLERVAALVGSALALAEAYERGHVELNCHDTDAKAEKRREGNALSFAAFFADQAPAAPHPAPTSGADGYTLKEMGPNAEVGL